MDHADENTVKNATKTREHRHKLPTTKRSSKPGSKATIAEESMLYSPLENTK